MKRRPFWVLKTRYGSYVTDPSMVSALQVVFFASKGAAERYAQDMMPEDWRCRAVKIHMNMIEAV